MNPSTHTHLAIAKEQDPQRLGQSSTAALVVLEGQHDCEFLRRIAAMLHRAGELPTDLATLEAQGTVILLPIGGGNLANWSRRLAPLGLLEFHLYDRELPPETHVRQAWIRQINERVGCRAVLTNKRSLENYLHASAIEQALGVQLAFDDNTPMTEALARSCHDAKPRQLPWERLPRASQKKFLHRAKRRLNTQVASRMTPRLLAERDPAGDLRSWLATIGLMALRR